VQRHRENKELAQVKKEMIEYSNSQIENIIDEYIHSERDRALLKRRLIDGICYEPLAEEFDLSTVQTKKIVYKLSEIVFRHIKA
jgi:hypothetical protein